MSLVGQIEIKSDGNLFHEIFRNRPHDIAQMSPDKIQGCYLVHGGWGTVGSTIFWNYTQDGTAKVAKEIYDTIDIGKKLITYKVIEGNLMECYKTFSITVQVDHKAQNNLITWTFVYEKLNDSISDPHPLMDFVLVVTKDIEAYCLKN